MAESMKGLHRTCRCAEVTKEMVGSKVTLMGWVQKARNKGGIVFVDLRDRSGIMQLIFENGNIDEEGFEKAGKLRSEFVIAVTGTVVVQLTKILQQVQLNFVQNLYVFWQNQMFRRSRLKRTARQKMRFV